MKKIVTTIALAVSLTAFAQENSGLTSKKGEPILPEAGDWGIGIDATPFLNYAGNFFGKTANNTAPTFNFLTWNQTIVGKYFKDEKTAYRAAIRLGMQNDKGEVNTANRGLSTAPSFPAAINVVKNTYKKSQTNIGLSGGIEMRKGKTRLQGYYGGELGVYFGSSKDVYTYGNALAPTATPAVVVSLAGDNIDGTNTTNAIVAYGQTDDARVTERKTKGILLFGIRGFIGAEYFVLPKLSIGGEFGWGLGFGSNGKTSTTYETTGLPTGATQKTVGTVTIEQNNGNGFWLDTDNVNSLFGPVASLRLNLYF